MQNSPSSTSSSNNNGDVHVTFTFDDNAYFQAYKYFNIPFKFVSILTVALILHRCYNLGLRRSSSTGLPLFTSTRNLVVIMALPVAVAIMTMISVNGIWVLEPGSQGWVMFSAGIMLPCLNLSSSILIGRFWHSRKHGATSVVADDLAKTQPVRTLLTVFVGLAADVFFTAYAIFSDSGVRPISIVSILLALGYIFTTAYFFYSGIQVLRSLSSSNKPLKAMAIYLIMVAGFTLMIIASFGMVSKEFPMGGKCFF